MKHTHKLLALAGAVLLAAGLTSCGLDRTTKSTSTASCAYVLGNGTNNSDSTIHNILLPGQKAETKDGYEVTKYIPCGPRNFIINPSGQVDAANQPIGDWHTASLAYTKDGTAIKVYSSTYFTLNQGALDKFAEVCFKYSCAADADGAAGANFATPGFVGLLTENFPPTIQQSAQTTSVDFGDSIWQSPATARKDWDELGKQMSAQFAAKMRAKLGYTADLFCGSGTSGWAGEPGKSDFNCAQVRVEITDVQANDDAVQGLVASQQRAAAQKTAAQQQAKDAQELAQQKLSDQAALNDKRVANAKSIYGDQAEYWLGLQDAIAACKDAQSTCVLNIGGSGGSQIPVSVTPTKPTG